MRRRRDTDIVIEIEQWDPDCTLTRSEIEKARCGDEKVIVNAR